MSAEVLVSGMTIIRNGIRLDYPFREVVRAALPVCDEYLIVAGKSEDGTVEAVLDLAREDERIRVIETEWSPRVVPPKCVLAQQTNVGLHLCRGAWCLALQANEVLHERDLTRLRGMLEEYADDADTEALLFERLTFFADYRHVVTTYPERYKWTARAVKPHLGTYALRDAMNFGVFDAWSRHGRNPRARDTGMDLYRYGMVHSDESYRRKHREAVHLEENQQAEDLNGRLPRNHVAEFRGEHPAVMAERIAAHSGALRPGELRDQETLAEKRRRLESAWYRRHGVPRWRHTRYSLIDGYAPKERGAY